MKKALLQTLACPTCKSSLSLQNVVEADGEIESATLHCDACRSEFPVRDFIPRFVPAENYATNFGLQWNLFKRTQLDSYSGVSISKKRFFGATGWQPEEMRGKKVLDVGCGAGRFAEIALGAGAEVVALDYSTAVDACRANLYPNASLNVIQGDIYSLPFREESFDFVYCLGVLQHTPDVEAAFFALPRPLKRGGKLAVDVYQAQFRNVLSGKYWVRPITMRIPPARLFSLVEKAVPILLPVSLILGKVPFVGRKLRQVLPISNYDGIHPLTRQQLKEWAVLDTFDMLSPAHDHPQTPRSLRQWFEDARLKDVEVFKAGHLVGRGVK